jgi:hypothetical protein
MLYKLQTLNDPKISLLKDDPVRPEIPAEFRVGTTTEVLILMGDTEPEAVVCVAYRDRVPESCNDLFQGPKNPEIVVFYTIWSYKPGAGRRLLNEASKAIKEEHPNFKQFVTLSPKTEMARKFHLSNGASILRENLDTINYEYSIENF